MVCRSYQLLMCLLMMGLPMIQLPQAFAGDEDNGMERGGGDSIEQDFRSFGAQVVERLKRYQEQGLDLGELKTLDVEKLKIIIDSTTIFSSTDGVTIVRDGKALPRMAANDPSKRELEVEFVSWNEAKKDLVSALSFVLHEYLAVYGHVYVDNRKIDQGYRLTAPFRTLLQRDLDRKAFASELDRRLRLFEEAEIRALTFRDAGAAVGIALIESTEDYRQCESEAVFLEKKMASCLAW